MRTVNRRSLLVAAILAPLAKLFGKVLPHAIPVKITTTADAMIRLWPSIWLDMEAYGDGLLTFYKDDVEVLTVPVKAGRVSVPLPPGMGDSFRMTIDGGLGRFKLYETRAVASPAVTVSVGRERS